VLKTLNFWGDIAENFLWRKKWDKVLEWNFKEPKVEWFKGAKLNITENCIDRHLEKLGETCHHLGTQ
jgi:acetyl-CoA synthetase